MFPHRHGDLRSEISDVQLISLGLISLDQLVLLVFLCWIHYISTGPVLLLSCEEGDLSFEFPLLRFLCLFSSCPEVFFFNAEVNPGPGQAHLYVILVYTNDSNRREKSTVLSLEELRLLQTDRGTSGFC